MMLAKIAVVLYGVLALIGGIIGYKNAQSKVSLISGTISGILLLLGGIVGFLGQSWGLPLATIVSAVLVVVFLARLWKTRKFMPAGLMIIFGVVVLLLAGSQVVS